MQPNQKIKQKFYLRNSSWSALLVLENQWIYQCISLKKYPIKINLWERQAVFSGFKVWYFTTIYIFLPFKNNLSSSNQLSKIIWQMPLWLNFMLNGGGRKSKNTVKLFINQRWYLLFQLFVDSLQKMKFVIIYLWVVTLLSTSPCNYDAFDIISQFSQNQKKSY